MTHFGCCYDGYTAANENKTNCKYLMLNKFVVSHYIYIYIIIS